MTTRVTVEASGPCYPARVKKFDKNGTVKEEFLVPSDFRYSTWVSTDERFEVVEEYWPEGYKWDAVPSNPCVCD